MEVLSTLLKKYETAKGRSVKRIPTDLLSLDYVLDGGFPLGRIIEIYGENGTGKTTTTMYIVKRILEQMPKKSVVFIDAEYSFNADWASKLGLDVEKLINKGKLYILYPKDMDEAFNAAIDVAKSSEASLIVIDSLATLLPREIFDENDPIAFSRPGLTAKKQTMFFETVTPILANTDTGMVVINQVRANISPYGASRSVPGAYAFKHLTAVRLETKREQYMGSKTAPTGIMTTIKCHKNKVGIPFRSESFVIDTQTGLDIYMSNIEFMLSRGYIKRNGSAYKIGDRSIKGREGVKKYFQENPKEYQEILKKCQNDILSNL